MPQIDKDERAAVAAPAAAAVWDKPRQGNLLLQDILNPLWAKDAARDASSGCHCCLSLVPLIYDIHAWRTRIAAASTALGANKAYYVYM